MNNVLVLQRSGSVAPTDYYKVGSSPFDTIRQHDTLGQIRNVDVRSDHGQTSYSELLYGNTARQSARKYSSFLPVFIIESSQSQPTRQ